MYSTLILGLAITVGAPGAKDQKKDPPSIVGEWIGEKATAGGKEKPVPEGGVVFMFAADGKVTITEGGRNGPGAIPYKVDPKKSPAEIDLIPPAKGKRDETMIGIYKIDGDTLTMCMSEGGERPTKFESPEGSKSILITLKRAKKN